MTVLGDTLVSLTEGRGAITSRRRLLPESITERGNAAVALSAPDEHGVQLHVASSSGISVWIWDDGAGRWIDRGRIPLPAPGVPSAIAVTDDGTLYAAFEPWGLRDTSSASLPILLSIDAGANEWQVIQEKGQAVASGAIILPGPNPVALRSLGGGAVALLYPAAGIVELYEDGDQAWSTSVCMSSRLAAFYRSQYREADRAAGTQEWTPLVTDIAMLGRGIAVVGPLTSSSSDVAMTHFEDGMERSIALRVPPSLRLIDIRFGQEPSTYVGLTADGSVVFLDDCDRCDG